MKVGLQQKNVRSKLTGKPRCLHASIVNFCNQYSMCIKNRVDGAIVNRVAVPGRAFVRRGECPGANFRTLSEE